jgi:hypothetical protein
VRGRKEEEDDEGDVIEGDWRTAYRNRKIR